MRLRDYIPGLRAFAAVFVAIVVVSAAIGSPAIMPDRSGPVGEAEAFACGGICIATGAGIAVGMGAGYVVNEYLSGDDTSSTYIKSDAHETEVEVYEHGRTIDSGRETVNTIMENQVQDGSRNIAWAKAKKAVISEMNAGANESDAAAAGRQAVADYYSSMQINLVNQWNDEIRKVQYINNVYVGHDSLSSDYGGPIYFMYDDNGAEYNYITDVPNATYIVTTANGTNLTATVVETHEFNSPSTEENFGPTPPSVIAFNGSGDYSHESFGNPFQLVDHSYNESAVPDVTIHNMSRTHEVYQATMDANSQMASNVDLYTQNLYQEYNAGDLNVSDIPDPSTLSQEYATDYNSTGYYAYAGADLALMGVGSGVNSTMTFDLNGTTYEGTLYTNWEPESTNGTFVTGYTYNISNVNQSTPVFISTQSEGLMLVTEDFTITEMVDEHTGEQVNETSLETYNRQTENVSLTMDELNSLLELSNDLDQEQAAAAGSSSSDDGLSLTDEQKALLVAGLALVLIAGSRRD